jgi:threonine dehydrogenase-like Zn-dependent dehydrogenase
MTAPAGHGHGQAATFRGAGVIELHPAPITPRPPGLARLRVDLCALCGSDKRLLSSGADVTPGHEIAGTITELPSEAPQLQTGQRALVYIPLHCGRCPECTAGQTNRCVNLKGLVGWQAPGGFRGYVDVPARNLIPVPDDIESLVAILGLDTIGTAAHGIRMCAQALTELPSTAAVVGCGPLGMGSVAALTALGVSEVWASEISPARAAAAVGLGAHMLASPPPARSFPLVVEASGTRAARTLALDLVRPGGAVLLLGESNDPLSMPATPSWRRTDAFYIRSFYFPLTEVPENFALLRHIGANLAARLCTIHPLTELPAIFKRFYAGELIKPVIRISQQEAIH